MSKGTLRGPGFPGPDGSDPAPPSAPVISGAADATAVDPAPAGSTWPSRTSVGATEPMAVPTSGVRAGAMFMDAVSGSPLRLDEADIQPPSLLTRPAFERADLVAGLVGIVAVPLSVVALWVSYHVLSFVGLLWLLAQIFGWIVAVFSALFGSANNTERALDRPPPEVENVVAARFVVLGEVLDPHDLPDRIVPILRTDTPEPTDAPSLREDPEPPPERERHERDRRSVDDAIRRLSDDAQIFAEMEEARIREGSPDGIEEGTERTGTEGDLYRGRVMSFFRRGWTVPTTLSDEAVAGLQCTAMIEVGLDTRIVGWRISRSSGNAEFDASIEAQLTRLMASEPNIPAPPEEVADQYLGREIAVRYSGRDARR